MISVFGSFLLESDATAKSMGFALAAGVLFDAFLVRMVLVPAFMHVAGRWNWWAPAPLARIHKRLGLSEGHVVATPRLAFETGSAWPDKISR